MTPPDLVYNRPSPALEDASFRARQHRNAIRTVRAIARNTGAAERIEAAEAKRRRRAERNQKLATA